MNKIPKIDYSISDRFKDIDFIEIRKRTEEEIKKAFMPSENISEKEDAIAVIHKNMMAAEYMKRFNGGSK